MIDTQEDIKYMKLAIALAEKGRGYTNPNPLVGAIIVRDNKIIGRGYHKKYGGNHAEICAIENAGGDVVGATMYVTLEPCSHFGKTPPCANLLVEKGIKRVVIALEDPNELVNGKGIQILKTKGMEVMTGVLRDEVMKQNEVFIKFITKKIPFTILKIAMTLDGKIATKTGDSKWISSESSRRYVHEMRHHVSAILVGKGTVIKDNPFLTARVEGKTCHHPMRVVLDSKLEISLDSNVYKVDRNTRTTVVTTDQGDPKKIIELEKMGVVVLPTQSVNGRVNLQEMLEKLGEMNIDSLLIEGGGTVNYSFLSEHLIDKVIAFVAPMILGGSQAITPVEGSGVALISQGFQLEKMGVMKSGDDFVIEGYMR